MAKRDSIDYSLTASVPQSTLQAADKQKNGAQLYQQPPLGNIKCLLCQKPKLKPEIYHL